MILAASALAVWGVYAVFQTPIDAVPDLSENQAIVFTEWPGHSPREIEDQITYPLSRTLQSLAGIRAVRGSSDVNYSMIYLIFADEVDFATARSRVQERLAGLAESLPAGVAPRLAPDAIPTGQIFWYTIEGRGYDLGKLRGVQDWFVKHQLESVPGVAEVASVGGQVVEYHVDLDPFKLRDRRVDLASVVRELARSNAAVGGNVIHKGNAEYIVRGVGWLGSGADSRRRSRSATGRCTTCEMCSCRPPTAASCDWPTWVAWRWEPAPGGGFSKKTETKSWAGWCSCGTARTRSR